MVRRSLQQLRLTAAGQGHPVAVGEHRAVATARPMPEPAPVTTATLGSVGRLESVMWLPFGRCFWLRQRAASAAVLRVAWAAVIGQPMTVFGRGVA